MYGCSANRGSHSRYIDKNRMRSSARFFKNIPKMSINVEPSRKAELAANYDTILSSVRLAESLRPVTLVAVSKLKPSSDIQALYDHGVRHFGENYVQELVAKSKELPNDIKWHFIGGLQTGKCKDLGRDVESLYAVETLDALKKVKKLEAARVASDLPVINVYLQLNTSGEDQKSGYPADDLGEISDTVEFLLNADACKKLKLKGLMTIGSLGESKSDDGTNRDFAKLCEVKKLLDHKFLLDLELSMGMSSDYIAAIHQGASSVRVGTSIFGQRPPRNGH